MTPPHLTRLDALDAWNVFLPRVKEYAARRDRLLTEGEVIRDTLGRYSIAAAEKWLQEACWAAALPPRARCSQYQILMPDSLRHARIDRGIKKRIVTTVGAATSTEHAGT